MKRITRKQRGRSQDNFVSLFSFFKLIKERRKLRCSIILSFALCGTAQIGRAKEIGPASDYCREINDPSSGTEIVFKGGIYKGACKVRRGGKAGSPLVIRGLSLTERPRIEYEGKNGNVLEIYADNIVIHGLEFGTTHSDVDGIRIFLGD